MAKGRKAKIETEIPCSVQGCTRGAVPKSLTVRTPYFVVYIQVKENQKPLCKDHMVEAMKGMPLPEMKRAPGEGLQFKDARMCYKKERQVTGQECFDCFWNGPVKTKKVRINHVGCQDMHLDPFPVRGDRDED